VVTRGLNKLAKEHADGILGAQGFVIEDVSAATAPPAVAAAGARSINACIVWLYTP
jgi:hypothetical protein